MKVRVKAGKELAHQGEVLQGGADLELLPHIAAEIPHLVDEVLPTGDVRAIGSADASAALATALESARPHERISLLEAARAKALGDVKLLDEQIAAERARGAETPAKPKPATPATPVQKEQ